MERTDVTITNHIPLARLPLTAKKVIFIHEIQDDLKDFESLKGPFIDEDRNIYIQH